LGAGTWYLNATSSGGCSVEGLQSAKCRVPSTNYWYTAGFGGRGLNCSVPGTNAAACWTNAPNTYVLDATCVDDSINGGACVTVPNRYVYSTQYGGRNTDCTSNSAGSCWFTGAKNITEPNLTATNIRTTNTIFGVIGSFAGVDTVWGSGMNHDLNPAINLTMNLETTTYAGTNALPAGYRPIANIDKDTEGAALNVIPQVTKVNRTGWAATTCGTTGVLAARIANCATVFGANATWNGAMNGNAGQLSWNLVSRSGAVGGGGLAGLGEEVWKDSITGLLWSSLVSSGLNWCKSVGNSNSQNADVVLFALNEPDPNSICDQVANQNQIVGVPVISACTEYTGLTTTDSAISNLGKSNLNKALSPSVRWRSPTMYDYMVANQNGLRFVMPDMQSTSQGDEWTATVYSADRALAWTFNGATGQRKIQNRSFLNSTRCIGR